MRGFKEVGAAEDTAEIPSADWLIFRVGLHLCALPLGIVIETMRRLPVKQLVNGPAFVDGLSIIRGQPTVVVDLAVLLGAATSNFTRLIVVKVGKRAVALGVEAVVGPRKIAKLDAETMPPLLRETGAEIVAAIARLDAEFLLLLQTAGIIPETALRALELENAAS